MNYNKGKISEGVNATARDFPGVRNARRPGRAIQIQFWYLEFTPKRYMGVE